MRLLRIKFRTILNPPTKHMMLPTSMLVTLASLVHVGIGWLGKNQAFVNIVDVNAPARLVQQRRMVSLEVVAEQGELKAASALKRTVTGATVTSKTSEQWNDMLLKVGNIFRTLVGEPLAQRRGGLDLR